MRILRDPYEHREARVTLGQPWLFLVGLFAYVSAFGIIPLGMAVGGWVYDRPDAMLIGLAWTAVLALCYWLFLEG